MVSNGISVSSGRLIFSEAKIPHVGIALRLPVYRKVPNLNSVEARRAAYVGSLGAGIRMADLLKDLASNENLRWVRFRVYDAGDFLGPRQRECPLFAGNGVAGLARPQADPGHTVPGDRD